MAWVIGGILHKKAKPRKVQHSSTMPLVELGHLQRRSIVASGKHGNEAAAHAIYRPEVC